MSDEAIGGSLYPEHDKMAKVAVQSQAVGDFIEGSGFVLCTWVPCQAFHEDGDTCRAAAHLVETKLSTLEVLAAYYEIDLDKIETEKRAMLEAMQARG